MTPIIMRHQIFSLVILFSVLNVSGQDLAAYSDYRGRFFIYDNGKNTLADEQRVESFAIGGKSILFQNSQGHLKLYQNGEVSKLEVGGAAKFFATDYLAAYSVFEKLKVIENGTARTLSYRCPIYHVQDNLIVYFDKNQSTLNIYANGNVIPIESGLMGMPVKNLKSGDNIVAYITAQYGNFTVYYKGRKHTLLEHIDNVNFKAGKDIIAYVSPIDESFKAFYKGQVYQLEEFPPESFKTGDGFVAYVDDMGSFKVFSDGHVVEVSGYAPDEYVAEDKILLFTENGYFKVYAKNQVQELEAYIPKIFVMDWNTLAYLDNTNRVWVFSNGEKKYVVNELIESFAVYRDLVVLNAKMDRNLIYHNGTIHHGASY